MITVSLIGEQPLPNLLPLRYQPPNAAILVHTDRTRTVAERLQRLLAPKIKIHMLHTDPYDIHKIREDLEGFLTCRELKGTELVFNLTGGTKTMVMAAYEVARKFGAPFFYLQSEGKRSVLYRYQFEGGEAQYKGEEILRGVLTIEDYLRAHLDEPYPKITGPKGPFEEAISEALKGTVDEVAVGVTLAPAVEVDLVVRVENRVGVIQAKTGSKAREKTGLDQLNAACEQRYLGTYTYKILAVNQQWNQTQTNLRELADAWRITVIELPSFTRNTPYLSEEDQKRLRERVIQLLRE